MSEKEDPKTLLFRCPRELDGLLPPPVPASTGLPDWFKAMPATAFNGVLFREFDTVNTVFARGGSLSAPGPTVADGMLFVGSGYGVVSQTPGNVLLAFTVR